MISTQNSQAVKKCAALKNLGEKVVISKVVANKMAVVMLMLKILTKHLSEKSCYIKGGSQQMAAKILMLINFNNGYVHYIALTSLQPFVGRHLWYTTFFTQVHC